MKTKVEVIQEAYGELWEEVKDCVDESGWCSKKETVNERELAWMRNQYGAFWRPISLKGIEHNNWWVKVESEKDLPKEDSEVFFVQDGRIINGYFYRGQFGDPFFLEQPTIYPIEAVTHYKLIEKPFPPIY